LGASLTSCFQVARRWMQIRTSVLIGKFHKSRFLACDIVTRQKRRD
jgi:hypothetical protein